MPKQLVGPVMKNGSFYSQRKYAPRRKYLPPATRTAITTTVKREMNRQIESKIFDQGLNGVGMNSVVLNVLDVTSGISRGTGDNQFIGDKISPTYLMGRFSLTLGDTTNICRLMVIQNIGPVTTPTMGVMFQNLVSPWLSPLNTDNDNKYRVLYDKIYSLDAAHVVRTGKIKINSKKLRPITYVAAGTVETGAIYIVALSDSAAVVDPQLNLRTRLHFKDA